MESNREIEPPPWDMATCDYYLQARTKSCTNPTGSCAFFGYPECLDLGDPLQRSDRDEESDAEAFAWWRSQQ